MNEHYTISSADDMRQLGKSLACQLKGGAVVELVGDVGAGKTTLTKGIAKGLGIEEEVQSPSFTLSRLYETPQGLQLAHYDFYRLHDPGILADELADTMGRSDTIVIIEWADIVASVLPGMHIRVTISATPHDVREVQITEVAS